MNDFRFAEQTWLNAFWLLLLLAVALLALELRGNRLLDRLLSPRMQSLLVRKPSRGRRLASIVFLVASIGMLILGLMRPQWGMSIQSQVRVDSQIMICLDVSKSMLAEDVVPSRLERAKAEINSLLSLMREGQQVGLMAFAGKASVLSPMTTDFGFLRMVLEEASPSTVGLGGTRIGEALRKAVDGFRDAGDINRLILLITDGEDHDSFPLDAAKTAREKGVRIVSVGFGDEAGSKIQITNPRTGAREFIKDQIGSDVISRLDGETLRDIARETEGAYIPAGTGALDLQSIYDAHIATLLAGSSNTEDRVVRNEAYQWCVVAALILLLIGLAAPTMFADRRPGSLQLPAVMVATSKRSAAVCLLGVSLAASTATAQSFPNTPPNSQSAKTQSTNAPDTVVDDSTAAVSGPGESTDSLLSVVEADAEAALLSPREAYNRAVSLVTSDPDRAEELLSLSRREAGVDGELRFRTLYNLGWVEVARADSSLPSAAEEALKHLQLAASYFRESIRVRADSQDARHNLEIVSRRILELTDSLATKDPQDLERRLDELIAKLRSHQAQLQQVVSRDRNSQSDSPNIDLEQLRQTFRPLGVVQRQVISDTGKLITDARQELAAMTNQQAEAPPEERLRAAQMDAMLQHLDAANQRLNKARSFTRRGQGERAFLRWSAGLNDAKRARDQLRNPVEVLGILIADARELAGLTEQLADSRAPLVPAENSAAAGAFDALGNLLAPQVATAPNWLSGDYLFETQQAMTQRVQELRSLFAAAVEQAANSSPASASSGGQSSPPPLTATPDEDAANSPQPDAQTLAALEAAVAPLTQAEAQFTNSESQLQADQFADALAAQSLAIENLLDAAELFFDVRRLIETMYGDQLQLQQSTQQLSDILQQASNIPEVDLPSTWTISSQIQQKNSRRAERLKSLLDEQLSQLEVSQNAAAPSPVTSPPGAEAADAEKAAAEQAAAEKQRTELALQLLDEARTTMQSVEQSFLELLNSDSAEEVADSAGTERPPSPKFTRSEGPQGNPTTIDPPKAQLPAASGVASSDLPLKPLGTAVDKLQELRRLYFSIVEHLRETAQRQSEVNDDTVELSAADADKNQKQVGPLQSRQANLQQTAKAIAEALAEQATQAAEAAQNTPPSEEIDPQAAQQNAEKLGQAAEFVREGSQALQQAVEKMQSLQQEVLQTAKPEAVESDPDSGAEKTGTAETNTDESAAPESAPAGAPISETAEGEAAQTQESADDKNSRWTALTSDQQTGLRKLLEALMLLDEPPENQDQDQQQQSNESQDQQKQQQESNEPAPAEQSNMNAEQLLQAIRDREAQRRQDKQPANAVSPGSVEKDW